MIGALPESLSVNGKEIPISSDFRIVLRIFEAFEDSALTDSEKAFVMVKLLYRDEISRSSYEEAVQKACWFCDGGDMPKSKPEKVKLMDWKHDESLIFPAVNRCAGFEVRSCEYMHWWTFLGFFSEIEGGLFSEVMYLRYKLTRGEKLSKNEKKFVARNKELVALRSDEEQAAINETEEFLKTII